MRHSTTDVAKRFSVDESTIRRWAERGAFVGAKKMGGRWKIPEAAVAHIEEHGLDLSTLPAEQEA